MKVQREKNVTQLLVGQLPLAGNVNLLECRGQAALPEPQLSQPARQALSKLHNELLLVYLLIYHLLVPVKTDSLSCSAGGGVSAVDRTVQGLRCLRG